MLATTGSRLSQMLHQCCTFELTNINVFEGKLDKHIVTDSSYLGTRRSKQRKFWECNGVPQVEVFKIVSYAGQENSYWTIQNIGCMFCSFKYCMFKLLQELDWLLL